MIKSLYGLKQAPKQWDEKFDYTLLAQGFNINECDKCVYIKVMKNLCVIVCLYVDDMFILETTPLERCWVQILTWNILE